MFSSVSPTLNGPQSLYACDVAGKFRIARAPGCVQIFHIFVTCLIRIIIDLMSLCKLSYGLSSGSFIFWVVAFRIVLLR